MLVGSCLAGIAFLKGLGLVHEISHMIGAEFDTQHGLTNAIILPKILEYNLPHTPEGTRIMASAIHLKDTGQQSFINHINALLDDFKIPTSLSKIGVPTDCVARIATKAMQDSAAKTNPVVASIEDLKELVRSVILKAR